jgi:hypothetical protein
MWTELIWHKEEPSGWLLRKQLRNFEIHKRQVISCLAERLLAPQEGFSSMELGIAVDFRTSNICHLLFQSM